MSEYVRCVGCGEIVEAQEPCSCVFDVVGVLDAQGVLHTAERVPVEWTEDDLWLDGGDRGEFAYRRINRAGRSYTPVYGREQAVRQDLLHMAKGKLPRAFR